MNSEIIKNFRFAIKDYQKEGKKIDKQNIYTCRNCGQEISFPTGSKRGNITAEENLSLHLMTCEKYNPNSKEGPATAV